MTVSDATMTCRICGTQTEELWAFSCCNGCWYSICGGDLADDWPLSIPPSATISAGSKTSALPEGDAA